MILKLYIENDLLDLFNDESIELTSSVATITDISKNTTDFVKSFTVPASSNNNKIFKHYYDANIDNAFDARVKILGRIELDGFPFRTGKWGLEKVILKKGKPYSYSINFTGDLISLKDKLGVDELTALDLTEFDHDYNSDVVKVYLQSSGDMIYNLLVKKQLYYKSSDTTPNTDKLANIAFGSSGSLEWDLLKPSIRLIKIIEAIETKYNLTFTRDFFGSVEFQNLYLWINNDGELKTISDNSVRIDFTNTGTITSDFGEMDMAEDTFTAALDYQKIFVNIVPSVGFETVEYSVEFYENGSLTSTQIKQKGTNTMIWGLSPGAKSSFVVRSNDNFSFSSGLAVSYLSPFGTPASGSATFGTQSFSADFIIKNHLPKIKVIDFLKGLFSMFKLVVVSDDNQNIYVDTIDNYYAKAKLWKVTKYIQTDTQEVSRGNLLNEIKFKFKEPKTILNKQFFKNTGFYYGDEEAKLTDNGLSTGKPLEGNPLSIELPFEQVIYERLTDLSDGQETNIMYGAIITETLEPTSIDPHIFYNIRTNLGTKTIRYLNTAGTIETISGNINTPSHSIDFENPQYNLVFGVENNEWTNSSSQNTLYFNHYKNYVESVFNIKSRVFKYKAVFPLRILLQLKLNDILEISNNYYRIDNFNINLITRDVTLNLMNAFDAVINGFTANVNQLSADKTPQTQSISIPNLKNASVTFEDGTWLTATIIGTNVFFAFDENTTGLTRIDVATITDIDTLQTIIIQITQTE